MTINITIEPAMEETGFIVNGPKLGASPHLDAGGGSWLCFVKNAVIVFDAVHKIALPDITCRLTQDGNMRIEPPGKPRMVLLENVTHPSYPHGLFAPATGFTDGIPEFTGSKDKIVYDLQFWTGSRATREALTSLLFQLPEVAKLALIAGQLIHAHKQTQTVAAPVAVADGVPDIASQLAAIAKGEVPGAVVPAPALAAAPVVAAPAGLVQTLLDQKAQIDALLAQHAPQ